MRIRGARVFRNEGDGCLTSKYVNDVTDPFTEACKFVGDNKPEHPFVGTYRTTWLERGDNSQIVPHDGTLVIRLNTNNTYQLEWNAASGQRYAGIGMIFNDLLVASYWSLPENGQ